MIDEKEILKELDERIDIQNRNIERVIQVSNDQAKLASLEGEIAAYLSVKKLIKEKSAHGAATPMSTNINSLTQEQYNTYQKKSEIRELAVEILKLSLQLQENTDGRIVWRGKNKPCVNFRYYGATSGFSIKIWKKGFGIEQLPDYSTTLFLDDWNCINEAGYLKEKLMGLLEERRGSDNGKDDSDHN